MPRGMAIGEAMVYVPTSEFNAEIENLISQICQTLITQEKYCIENNLSFEERRPNFEAICHASPYLSIHYAPNIGFLVVYDQKFIGKLNYWDKEERHYITNSHTVDTSERRIEMNTIISLERLLKEITRLIGKESEKLKVSLDTVAYIDSVFARAKYSIEIIGSFLNEDNSLLDFSFTSPFL